ncbi:ABC transporter ATP-binding protein [bacterium]|nr:ABC transporter ATP-binding protein [bacterium]
MSWLWLLFLMTLLSSAVALAFPRVIGYLVDAVNGLSPKTTPQEAHHLALVYILILAGVGLARTLAHFYPATRALVNCKIEVDVRQRYFSQIVDKGFRFFNKFRTGDLVTRLTDDIGGFPKIAWFCCSGIFRAVESASKFLFCVLFMLTMNWQLTLLIIIPLPVMLFIFYRVRMALTKRSLERQKIISTTNDALESSFSGIRILKAFRGETEQSKRFDTILRERIEVEFRLMKLWMMMHNTFMGVQFLGQIIVVIAGGLMVINNTITIGELTAFFVYVGMLLPPMMDIPNLFVTSRTAFACIDREIEIEETPGGTENYGQGREQLERFESIQLTGAGFSYDDKLAETLSGIDLEIKRGERVAIVGAVGSGKTTLLKLISGLLPSTAGMILLNGRPLSQFDLASLRARCGYIPQEATLFSESVVENVSFGRDLAQAQIDDALRLAQVYDEMTALPEGLKQVLGQKGLSISGGQKQRLAIARALAGGPELLLMDDCTSALDAENERAFWDEFTRRHPDAACLIVTHRLATARQADVIYVLDKGRIAGRGSHEELLASCEQYRNMLTKEELRSALGIRRSA